MERCCGSLPSWKKLEQFSGSRIEFVGGSEKFGEWRVLEWGGALFRLYALLQVKFQECVNDSYDAWSSFLYVSNSRQYIQHFECRVRSSMEYFRLWLCSVWKHTVYCRSEHNYLYLETASCLFSLWPPSGHQYCILKEAKMQQINKIYIYIYIYIYKFTTFLHSVGSEKCSVYYNT